MWTGTTTDCCPSLRSSVEQQFMGPWQTDLIRVGTDWARLLPELVQAGGVTPADRLDRV